MENRPRDVAGASGVCAGAETRRQRSPTSGLRNRGGARLDPGYQRPGRAGLEQRIRRGGTRRSSDDAGLRAVTALRFVRCSPRAWDPVASVSLPKRDRHPQLLPPAPGLLPLGWACAQVRGSEPRPEAKRARPHTHPAPPVAQSPRRVSRSPPGVLSLYQRLSVSQIAL